MYEGSLPVNAPPDLTTQRLGKVDGCPSCAQNIEAPRSVVADRSPGEFTAFYRCGDCEHVWYTSWRDA